MPPAGVLSKRVHNRIVARPPRLGPGGVPLLQQGRDGRVVDIHGEAVPLPRPLGPRAHDGPGEVERAALGHAALRDSERQPLEQRPQRPHEQRPRRQRAQHRHSERLASLAAGGGTPADDSRGGLVEPVKSSLLTFSYLLSDTGL